MAKKWKDSPISSHESARTAICQTRSPQELEVFSVCHSIAKDIHTHIGNPKDPILGPLKKLGNDLKSALAKFQSRLPSEARQRLYLGQELDEVKQAQDEALAAWEKKYSSSERLSQPARRELAKIANDGENAASSRTTPGFVEDYFGLQRSIEDYLQVDALRSAMEFDCDGAAKLIVAAAEQAPSGSEVRLALTLRSMVYEHQSNRQTPTAELIFAPTALAASVVLDFTPLTQEELTILLVAHHDEKEAAQFDAKPTASLHTFEQRKEKWRKQLEKWQEKLDEHIPMHGSPPKDYRQSSSGFFERFANLPGEHRSVLIKAASMFSDDLGSFLESAGKLFDQAADAEETEQTFSPPDPPKE